MALRFFTLAIGLVGLGILGFVLPTPVFGAVDVTPALNLIHIAAGAAAGIAATRGLGTMRAYGRWLGYTFAVLTAAAMVMDGPAIAQLLPLTNSNAWFHLALALAFLYNALLAPPR